MVIQSFFPLSPPTPSQRDSKFIRTNWRSLHKYQMGHSASSGSQYTSFVNTLYNPWNFSAPSKKEGYTHQRQQITSPWGSWCCLISIGDTMLWKMWLWISLVDAPLDTSAYTWTCTCTQIHSYHTHRTHTTTQTPAQQTIVHVMNKLFHECFLPCTSPPLSLTLPRSVHNTSWLYQHITVNGVITVLHYLVMTPLSHLLVSTPRPGL